MYSGLLHTHSALRYVVLLLLIAVVVKSLLGWLNQQPFKKIDNSLSLSLLIATHTQFLVGLILYLNSPFVQFTAASMKDKTLRFWTVEHATMMILAVALITVARNTHKKLSTDTAKHKRLFVLNAVALALILSAIGFSGRASFSIHW